MKKIATFLIIPLVALFSSCNNNDKREIEKINSIAIDTIATTELKKDLTAEDIYNMSKESVAMIICYDRNRLPISQGSGFFINDTTLITNHHVIEGSYSVEYKLIGDDNLYKDGRVVSASKKYDIAIINTQKSHVPIQIDTISTQHIGEHIYVLSNPRGLEGTLSEGIISALRNENYDLIQITAPISSGSSGAPLINKEGKAIGLSTFTFVDSQNLNFAIPLYYISECTPYVPKPMNNLKKSSTNDILKEDAILVSKMSIVYDHFSDRAAISIKNNSNNIIKRIKGLILFYDRNGDMYDYKPFELENEYLPNLTKQEHIYVGEDITHPGEHWGLRTQALYRLKGNSRNGCYYFSYSSTNAYVPMCRGIEIRILYYEIKE